MRLARDEQVRLRVRRSGGALALPLVLLLAGLVAVGYALSGLDGWPRWAVVAVAALVVLRWSARPWLRWLTTTLVVTDRRVRSSAGVLRRRTRDVPLSRLVDVEVQRSLGQRLSGTGTLLLAVRDEGGVIVVPDVRHPHAVADDLLDLIGEG